MTRFLALLLTITVLTTASHSQQEQSHSGTIREEHSANVAHAQTEPSLQETFDWMTNTLRPAEGNAVGIHHPFADHTPDQIRDGWNPNNGEIVTNFSHTSCKVEFDVDVFNNDQILNGKRYDFYEVDTFDLKDIDPNSIRIVGLCDSDTSQPPCIFRDADNGNDMQGKIVAFQTSDAKPRIHSETSSSTATSQYGYTHKEKGKTVEETDEELCKAMPSNTAYCNLDHKKDKPVDETFSTLWFSTPEYANRFAKAFRRAVELCGGKKSAF